MVRKLFTPKKCRNKFPRRAAQLRCKYILRWRSSGLLKKTYGHKSKVSVANCTYPFIGLKLVNFAKKYQYIFWVQNVFSWLHWKIPQLATLPYSNVDVAKTCVTSEFESCQSAKKIMATIYWKISSIALLISFGSLDEFYQFHLWGCNNHGKSVTIWGQMGIFRVIFTKGWKMVL